TLNPSPMLGSGNLKLAPLHQFLGDGGGVCGQYWQKWDTPRANGTASEQLAIACSGTSCTPRLGRSSQRNP
ncbi:MAG: hypothetical protein AAGG51_19585, partial [Cyanobacteria bacterium P01_G01_bin.54]